MTTLLLIRHGESEANKKDIYVGQMDVPLTERGRQQAEIAAEYISKNYQVDAVYSSDLIRAYKTAEALAEKIGLPIVTDRNLREIDGGEWEGIPLQDMEARFGKDHSLWLKDIGNARCTGGESVREMGQRVLSCIKKIAEENEGRTVAIAIHATPIRALECLLCRANMNEMKDIPWVTNASLTTITYTDGTLKMIRRGFDEYLDTLKTYVSGNI